MSVINCAVIVILTSTLGLNVYQTGPGLAMPFTKQPTSLPIARAVPLEEAVKSLVQNRCQGRLDVNYLKIVMLHQQRIISSIKYSLVQI